MYSKLRLRFGLERGKKYTRPHQYTKMGVFNMAKIYVSEESPIDFAVMQTYEIATQHLPDSAWEAEAILSLANQIGNRDEIQVQIRDGTLTKAISAINSVKTFVQDEFKEDTLNITQNMLEEAKKYS